MLKLVRRGKNPILLVDYMPICHKLIVSCAVQLDGSACHFVQNKTPARVTTTQRQCPSHAATLLVCLKSRSHVKLVHNRCANAFQHIQTQLIMSADLSAGVTNSGPDWHALVYHQQRSQANTYLCTKGLMFWSDA